MASGRWDSAPRKSGWRRSETCGRDGGARSVVHTGTAGGLDDGGAADRDEPGAIIVTIAMPRLDLRRFRIDAAVRDANLMDPGAHRLAIQKQHNVVVALYTVQGNVMQLEEGSR